MRFVTNVLRHFKKRSGFTIDDPAIKATSPASVTSGITRKIYFDNNRVLVAIYVNIHDMLGVSSVLFSASSFI